MKVNAIGFVPLLLLLGACISAPAPEMNKSVPTPVPTEPGNVVYYTAFKDYNLEFKSPPPSKLVGEEIELQVAAPEGVELSYTVKFNNTYPSITEILNDGKVWKAKVVFPQNGTYEISVLVKKDKNNYYGAAAITVTAQVPEESSLYAFDKNKQKQWVRIKDAKEVKENWNPGKFNFYYVSYTKYMTGTLVKDTVFTIKDHSFSLPAGQEIRFGTGGIPSRYVSFIPQNNMELTLGGQTLQFKQGMELFISDIEVIGTINKEYTAGFMGVSMVCPAGSVVGFSKDQFFGVQFSGTMNIAVQKNTYPCKDYVFVNDMIKDFSITLAKDTPIKTGNTKLVCPADSSIAFNEKGIVSIYLSKDTVVTVDGKNQTVKTGFSILFDEKGNFQEALEESC